MLEALQNGRGLLGLALTACKALWEQDKDILSKLVLKRLRRALRAFQRNSLWTVLSKGAFRRLRSIMWERSDHTFLVTVGSEFPSLENFANLFEKKRSDFLGGKFLSPSFIISF